MPANATDVHYYGTDHPGNVVALFTSGGTVKNEYRYRVFGEFWSGQPPKQEDVAENSLKYAGTIHDEETGLYYMRSRYYSPWLERFLSEDPIGLEGGINPYAYAANSPTNLRNPFGLQPEGGSDDEKEECPGADEGELCWGEIPGISNGGSGCTPSVRGSTTRGVWRARGSGPWAGRCAARVGRCAVRTKIGVVLRLPSS